MVHFAEKELDIKQKMMDKLDKMSKDHRDTMKQLTSNLKTLSDSVTNAFSLLQQSLLQRPSPSHLHSFSDPYNYAPPPKQPPQSPPQYVSTYPNPYFQPIPPPVASTPAVDYPIPQRVSPADLDITCGNNPAAGRITSSPSLGSSRTTPDCPDNVRVLSPIHFDDDD